jgi:hypothetical protein
MKRLIREESKNNAKKYFNLKKNNRRLQAAYLWGTPLWDAESGYSKEEEEFMDYAKEKINETFPNSKIDYYYDNDGFGLSGDIKLDDALNIIKVNFNSLEKTALEKFTNGKVGLYNPNEKAIFLGFTEDIDDLENSWDEVESLKKELKGTLDEEEIKSFNFDDFFNKLEKFLDGLYEFLEKFCEEMNSEKISIFEPEYYY